MCLLITFVAKWFNIKTLHNFISFYLLQFLVIYLIRKFW